MFYYQQNLFFIRARARSPTAEGEKENKEKDVKEKDAKTSASNSSRRERERKRRGSASSSSDSSRRFVSTPAFPFLNSIVNVYLTTAHQEVHRREAVLVQTLGPALAAQAIHPVRRPHRRVILIAVRKTGVAVRGVPPPAKKVLVRLAEQPNHHAPTARLARNLSVNVRKEIATVYSVAEPVPEIVLVEPHRIGPVAVVVPRQTT